MPTTHHVGLTVTDLDRAVEFYREIFELEVLRRFSVSGEEFATAVDVPNAVGSFAHLDGDGIRIELVEYEPLGDEHSAPQVNQPGAMHLGFSVDDVDAFYRRLPADVETLSDPRTTSTGTRILFLRDPEGNLVEVLET